MEWGLTFDQVYAPALHECLHRARIVSSLPLQLPERVFLLKIWVLPVLGWTSKAYFPSDSVVRQAKMVYRVALRLYSWGLYFLALSQAPNKGGFALIPPDVFWAAYPYIRVVSNPEWFSQPVVEYFNVWAMSKHRNLTCLVFDRCAAVLHVCSLPCPHCTSACACLLVFALLWDSVFLGS